MALQPLKEIKLCLLGNTLVGKTSVVLRFLYDTFGDRQELTQGAAHYTKVTTVSGITFKYRIWDTAGEERYRALAPLYYRDAVAAIIVYDVTSKESFETVKKWFVDLRRNSCAIAVIALVGNKSDLADARRVDEADAKLFAADQESMFFEISAKTGHNVRNVFDAISERLYRLGLLEDSSPRIDVIQPNSNEQPAEKGHCC